MCHNKIIFGAIFILLAICFYMISCKEDSQVVSNLEERIQALETRR